jgi:DNA-binding transcriptional ArsR family regulator
MTSGNDDLSQDVIFDILSSPRRRYVLYYLRKEGGPIDLTQLAERVAAWENKTTVENLTNQERKRVYVSLYQTHVPKLSDVGIVSYDQESGMVDITEQAHEVDTYLTRSEETFPWQRIYLVLASLGALLLLFVSFDFAGFAGVSEIVVATVVILVFAITAVLQYLYHRSKVQEIPPELQARGEP